MAARASRGHGGEGHNLVAELFGALEAGDIERALDFWAEDCIDHTAIAGAPTGRPGVRATLAFVLAAFPSARWRISNVVTDAQRVACQVVVEGKHEGDIYGVAASGRQVRWRHFHHFRFEEGRIVEHDAVRDDLGLLRQLGVEWPGG